MPQEIEHKYLVRLDVWQPTEQGVLYRQGYLSTVEERVVRVRIAGERAYLTIKGAAHGITRLEFEYAIPVADAATMLDLLRERPYREDPIPPIVWREDMENRCLPRRQCRHRRRRGGGRGGSEPVELPPWLGHEVSDDPRYFNSNLVNNPYKNWRAPAD